MKLVSELKISLKKGLLPYLIDEAQKNACRINKSLFVEESDGVETYDLEIIYTDRALYKAFLEYLGASSGRYEIISSKGRHDDLIKGGLLVTASKIPIVTLDDFDTAVKGSSLLIQEKIAEGLGDGYTGISKAVAMVGAKKILRESDPDGLLSIYSRLEIDSIILSRFSGYNAFPLVFEYTQTEDLVKIITRLKVNFRAVRFGVIEDPNIFPYTSVFEEIGIPVISMEYDEIPFLTLSLLLSLFLTHGIFTNETNVGILGLTPGSLRLTKLLIGVGCQRVLGFDHNEGMMMNFENSKGMATTTDNIFNNSDVTVVFKKCFDISDLPKMRPGQYVLSFVELNENEKRIMKDRGVREIISVDLSALSSIFPGAVNGIIDSGIQFLDDEKIIEASRKLSRLVRPEYILPDVISGVHEVVSGFISR